MPVVIHDATLKRTAQIDRRVSELSATELQEIDVGGWFTANKENLFLGEKLPTLAQVFELFSTNNGRLYVEMKCAGDEGAEHQHARLCKRELDGGQGEAVRAVGSRDGMTAEYARLLDSYDNSFRNIAEGEVVKGTVLKVTPSEVVVDVGYKSEGIIPITEFVDERGEVTVQPGDLLLQECLQLVKGRIRRHWRKLTFFPCASSTLSASRIVPLVEPQPTTVRSASGGPCSRRRCTASR